MHGQGGRSHFGGGHFGGVGGGEQGRFGRGFGGHGICGGGRHFGWHLGGVVHDGVHGGGLLGGHGCDAHCAGHFNGQCRRFGHDGVQLMIFRVKILRSPLIILKKSYFAFIVYRSNTYKHCYGLRYSFYTTVFR